MELAKMLEMVRLTEDELIGGFISPKKGYYYIVLNRKDKDGKRKPLWISTGLPAIEENKAEAESKCLSARIQYSLDVKNGVADKTFEHETPEKKVVQDNSDDNHSANPLFADLLNEWLEFRHPDNIVVGEDFSTTGDAQYLGRICRKHQAKLISDLQGLRMHCQGDYTRAAQGTLCLPA